MRKTMMALATIMLFAAPARGSDVAPPSTESEAIARLNGEPIQLRFDGMPLGDVIKALAAGAGVVVKVHPPQAFGVRVTLSCSKTPWDLLRQLVTEHDITVVWKEGGWEFSRAIPGPKHVTTLYPLTHATAERTQRIVADIRDSLTRLAEKEGAASVTYNPQQGGLEISASPLGHAIARQYLRTADVPTVQVRVDVTVVTGPGVPVGPAVLSLTNLEKLLDEVREAGNATITIADETFTMPGHKRIGLPNGFCDVYVHPFRNSQKLGLTFAAEVQGSGGVTRSLRPDPSATASAAKPAGKLGAQSAGVVLKVGEATIARDGEVLIAIAATIIGDGP